MFFGMYSLFDKGLMTSTFDNYLCDGVNVIIFSLVHVVCGRMEAPPVKI
jgi:hypothetical protein